MRFQRWIHASTLVAAAAAFLLPTPVDAQFSTIGQGTLERSPVFTPTAMVHDARDYSVGGFFGYLTFVEDLGDFGEFAVDLEVVGMGGAYGLTDRITIGAMVPYETVRFEFGEEETEDSGLGNAALFGKWQFFRSRDAPTKLTAVAGLTLPTGEEDVGAAEETTLSLGGAASHEGSRFSFHGSLALDFVIGEEGGDGLEDEGSDTAFRYSAAAVYQATDRLNLIGEFSGLKVEEVDVSNAAAVGGRFVVGRERTLFLDGGAFFGISDTAPDSGFLIRLLLVR
jgi:hypothetical protein